VIWPVAARVSFCLLPQRKVLDGAEPGRDRRRRLMHAPLSNIDSPEGDGGGGLAAGRLLTRPPCLRRCRRYLARAGSLYTVPGSGRGVQTVITPALEPQLLKDPAGLAAATQTVPSDAISPVVSGRPSSAGLLSRSQPSARPAALPSAAPRN
jgi:hypothetical protein